MAAISARGDQYGLPVGGNASRILAEALLIRTDNFMKESGMKFCRFVDDFIVFANSPEEAYSILNSCADYFLRNMGLSLQKNKTSIITRAEFKSHIKSVFDEIESEKDPARASILRLKLHKDKYSEMGDEDLRDLKDKIDGSELIRLLKSECRKTKINQMFGKQLVNAVQVLDDDDQSKAFEVLSVNFEKLYPVFPVIMRKAYYNLPKCNNETQEMFIRRLADLFDTNSYIIQTDNNASYAIRVLSLDKTGKAEQTIARLFEGNTAGTKDSSSLIRMNAIYAMTNRRNINWLTCRLQDFPHLSSWERRAVAASAAFLGTEGKTWRSTFRTYSSPMENLVGDWASEKLSEKPNWKLPL
jgi:hypothetical protein